MRGLFLRLYDFLSTRKVAAAVLLAVVLGASLFNALRMQYEEDITSFLPKEELEQLKQTKGQDRMAVFFQGGTLHQRIEAMEAFESHWNEACPDIPVSARADDGEVLATFRFVSENWPYFLEEADYLRMDSLLAQPGFYRQRLSGMKAAMYGLNPLQERYFRTDPLGLCTPVLQRLNRLRPESRLEDGCLFTPDGKTGILFFTSPYGSSESGQNAGLVAVLDQVKARTAQEFPQLRVFSTGAPEVSAGNAGRIKKDSFLALALAMVLIFVVLWFSYKRWADVLWILISIATGALLALGIIACFKSSISIIVLGIGCTIIGLAVNYPLHYVDHLKYQPDKRKALAEQINPLLVGNITTVAAFLGLLLLKADALHDFGFIGAMMLVGTIVFVLVFLPVFLPVAKGPRKVVRLDVDRYFKLGDKPYRPLLLLLFVGLTVFFSFTGSRVGFDTDLHHINYMTAEQEEGFALLESMRPTLPGDNDEWPVMDGFERPVQERALGLWTAFWASHPEVPVRLAAAASQEGFSARAFQPFLDAVAQDWEPQGRDYFQPVDFAPERGVADGLVRNLAEDFNTIGLLCSLIVFVFLWISLGSLELSLMSFLPLAVGWIWILGMMGLTGLQFNIVNIILATFIFGQGDDYTIFMTEGLMYEYATGKKVLHSYKNSVMLSGLIMFIGIGVLVVARHPAMRSLGLVTVIGMMTVVAMAYILPPLVFRFLTRRSGARRSVPLTLRGILGTFYLMLQMVFWMTLLSILTIFIPKGVFFHRIIRRVAQAAIHLVPGCRYTQYNPHGEDFSKPAVYICNHQSHLDVLALIALHPKLIFMTNDWVWKFPFYGAVIRKAGYFPVSWGLSRNSKHIKELVSRGYSIVFFPEGTRSVDGSIQRFHRGAFLTAQELGLKVVPICIHGFSYALPKRDFFLRKAPLYLEIGQRVAVPKEADIVRVTRGMAHFYRDWYARIRRERESAAFYAPFVRMEYMYKGHDTQLECRRVLRPEVYRQVDALTGPEIVLENAGCGVRALLTALTHPDKTVIAHIAEEESYLTAVRCRIPENLHYVQD
ncbi:MAG: 1-acyl-sn-glycerol-3-phosphate acyltransferase [Bacteroidales bacterium]|nr:1-acyl-sn-glycerol-3-phosphate acyltransferase [Bacteroidales bacterium]